MKNLKKILCKSISFLKLYLKDYLKLLIKPILIGLVGMLLLALCLLGPIGAIIALFSSIPCTCYAFWRGYLITYSLNYAVESYMRTENKVSIIDCYELTKKEGSKLAAFLGYSALVCLLVCLSAIILIPTSVSVDFRADFMQMLKSPELSYKYFIVLFPCFLLLSPFYNFLNQAFFYRKSNEGFNNLLFNCYKNLDKAGMLLCAFFAVGLNILGVVNVFIFAVVALILNPFIYCANMLWYKQKIGEN